MTENTSEPKIVTTKDANVVLREQSFRATIHHVHPKGILIVINGVKHMETVDVTYDVSKGNNSVSVDISESAHVTIFSVSKREIDWNSVKQADYKSNLSRVLVNFAEPIIKYEFERTGVEYNPRVRMLSRDSLIVSDAGTELKITRDKEHIRFVLDNSITINDIKGIFRAEPLDTTKRVLGKFEKFLGGDPYRSHAKVLSKGV